jgi:hypothetical protein
MLKNGFENVYVVYGGFERLVDAGFPHIWKSKGSGIRQKGVTYK